MKDEEKRKKRDEAERKKQEKLQKLEEKKQVWILTLYFIKMRFNFVFRQVWNI